MAGVFRRIFLYAGLVLLAALLICEVGFIACLCIVAFRLNVTRAATIPAIMFFLLAAGWMPLLLRRYTRRAFVFSLLVMTASFAISCSIASMLIVTEVRPLKLPAVVIISWLAGGLWGWVIVYLDRQKWRMGEKLGIILHGHKPMADAGSRRPVMTVVAVSILAILVCVGVWVVGREKLLNEVWSESGYRKRLALAQNLVEFGMLTGRPETQLRGYFGQPARSEEGTASGEKKLWWSIGIAPPGATSYNAGQHAYLLAIIVNGKTAAVSIEYEDPDAKPDIDTKAP